LDNDSLIINSGRDGKAIRVVGTGFEPVNFRVFSLPKATMMVYNDIIIMGDNISKFTAEWDYYYKSSKYTMFADTEYLLVTSSGYGYELMPIESTIITEQSFAKFVEFMYLRKNPETPGYENTSFASVIAYVEKLSGVSMSFESPEYQLLYNAFNSKKCLPEPQAKAFAMLLKK
jgi:hypothetical protein